MGKRASSTSPAAKESHLVSMAIDEIERRLKDGSISSQLLALIFKAGTEREMLEREKLHHETALLSARSEQIVSERRSDEFYQKVLSAYGQYDSVELADDQI